MMTQEQITKMMAELEAARAENALLKAKKAGVPSFKVSEKGAVSVYGLGRFPVTLYAGQWKNLFAVRETLEAFIAKAVAEGKISLEKPIKAA